MRNHHRSLLILFSLAAGGCTFDAAKTLDEDEVASLEGALDPPPAPPAACLTASPDVELDPVVLEYPSYFAEWSSPSASYDHPGCGKYFISDIWDYGQIRRDLPETYTAINAMPIGISNALICNAVRVTVHVYRRSAGAWKNVSSAQTYAHWSGTRCESFDTARVVGNHVPASSMGYRMLASAQHFGTNVRYNVSNYAVQY